MRATAEKANTLSMCAHRINKEGCQCLNQNSRSGKFVGLPGAEALRSHTGRRYTEATALSKALLIRCLTIPYNKKNRTPPLPLIRQTGGHCEFFRVVKYFRLETWVWERTLCFFEPSNRRTSSSGCACLDLARRRRSRFAARNFSNKSIPLQLECNRAASPGVYAK